MNKKILITGLLTTALMIGALQVLGVGTGSCSGYLCDIDAMKKGSDGIWRTEETFIAGEDVGVMCSNFPANEHMTIYIVLNQGWSGGEDLSGAVEDKSVTTGPTGFWLGTVWTTEGGDEGLYDIVVDVNEDGSYTAGVDAVLSKSANVMAFEVVPEVSTLALMGVGLISMIGYLGITRIH